MAVQIGGTGTAVTVVSVLDLCFQATRASGFVFVGREKAHMQGENTPPIFTK